MTHRTILHVDLDAFFCSVEQNLDPRLEGVPFVVGGTAEGRGVVSSASYPARKFGIHSAMPTAQAIRLCPDLLVLPPRFKVYGKLSRQVMDHLREAAPVLEQLSIDEAFLDMTAAPGQGGEVAARLQKEIRNEFRLPTSWGVAGNKHVAKIATEVGKPNGLIDVPRGREAEFLAPLPVGMLWGVGPKTREKLAALGIESIGDLARSDLGVLATAFGQRAPELVRQAKGIDDSPVVEERQAKSISAETTFPMDVSDRDALLHTLSALSDQVGFRLRKAGVAASTIRLKLRWPDFSTVTRQTQIEQATDQDREIYAAAVSLFEDNWKPGKPVRLLGVAAEGLGPPVRQLGLFDGAWQNDEKLLEAIDSIRARYGPAAVRRGASLRSSNPRKTDDRSR